MTVGVTPILNNVKPIVVTRNEILQLERICDERERERKEVEQKENE